MSWWVAAWSSSLVVVVVVLVVVVVGTGVGWYCEYVSIGRYRSGRGQASRSMLRALFETMMTIEPKPSRHGSRWA